MRDTFVEQRLPAADQLPEVIDRLLADESLKGVFHCGGAERATRFDMARTFARVMDFDESLVRTGRAVDVKFASPRPRDSSLDSSRLAAAKCGTSRRKRM